jgi:DNA-binding MarR family transcriptional regulator
VATKVFPDDAALLDLTANLARLHLDHVHAIEVEFGLSPLEVRVLRALEPDEARPMCRVAEAIGCNPANATTVVDRLEARGLVERTLDPGDRRVRALVLTDDGMRIRAAICERLGAAPAWLAGLDPEERLRLADLLARVRDLGGVSACPDSRPEEHP